MPIGAPSGEHMDANLCVGAGPEWLGRALCDGRGGSPPLMSGAAPRAADRQEWGCHAHPSRVRAAFRVSAGDADDRDAERALLAFLRPRESRLPDGEPFGPDRRLSRQLRKLV